MVPSNDERVKEIFACLALFCLAVWYFTAEFLGIYSFLLAFAVFVFGFFLIVFCNWCLSNLSYFRTTRYRMPPLFSFHLKCYQPTKNNCKPDISQGSSCHVEEPQDGRGRRGHL